MCSLYEFVDIHWVRLEILKVVENLLKQRVSRKPGDRAFDEKNCPGGRDLTNFENLPRGCVGVGDSNTWN